MKRVGNIYPRICDENNIRSAIMHASRGKTNRENVTKVIENIDYYVDDVYKMLIDKNIKLSPYKKM